MNMKRVFLPILSVVLVLIFAQIVSVTAQESALWHAEFFDNAIFADPSVGQGVFGEIAFDWNDGSPGANVPSDNFSARFGADVVLSGGNYRFWALADDYVIVTVDFQSKIIDSFNQDKVRDVLTGDVTLGPGTHHIQVDYRENTGDAYLFVGFANIADNVPIPTTPQLLQEPITGVYTGVTARVTAYRLNVRRTPSTSADILTKISFGEVYPVAAQTPLGDWVQVNVGGTLGWVSASFVTLQTTTVTPQTAFVVNALGNNVNIRSAPDVASPDLGTLPAYTSATLIGRNASNTWWQINYNGLIGWVSGQFTALGSNIDVNAVPITG